jgi:uncharacterized protein (PEP-CTERM system associated)
MASARVLALHATLLALYAATAPAQIGETAPRGVPGKPSAESPIQAPREAAQRSWEIIPALTVSETYTDNVTLTQDALKLSDWVTQVVPEISIARRGPRLQLRLDYTPEFVHYARETGKDDVFHRGNAIFNAELARQLFYLAAGARVDQYNVTLQGPLSVNNINVTGNRATATTAYATPYAKHDFGTAASAEARFTHSRFSTDDPRVLESDADRVNLRLGSVAGEKRSTWEIAYLKEVITYDLTRQEILSEVLTADAKRLVTSSVGLLGQVGYEIYDSGIPGARAEDSRWRAGFDWTPTPRTRIAATAGERFDEDTYTFELSHRTRLATWSASYSEDITTSRAEFFVPAGTTAASLDSLFVSAYPDPAARQRAVQNYVDQTGLPPNLAAPVNFYTDQLFLTKRGQVSVALQGARNTVIANLYTDTRSLAFAAAFQPVTGDFAISNNIRQIGGSATWSWRITERNAWNAQAAGARREFLDTGRIDDTTVARLALTRQFQPKLSGSLAYRWQDNKSNQSGLDYTENAVIASIRARFDN